jgi:O-methyltransferase
MRLSKTAFPEPVATAWLHLLKKTLLRYPIEGHDFEMIPKLEAVDPPLRTEIERWIALNHRRHLHESGADLSLRAAGKDWPATAETMIGLFRMDNLHGCLLDVLRRNVDGDLVEAGVWRGGAGIMMRAVSLAIGEAKRKIWLVDSFEGLPKPDPEGYPADAGDPHWTYAELAVSLDTVKGNFQRYGLLDDQVRFLKGWFRDTLPNAPMKRIALLHLDSDMYESTIVALRNLYPRITQGGYIIVDDYGGLAGCRQAVDDFRREIGITAEMRQVDWTGVFWQV